jgi:hypothetical protein
VAITTLTFLVIVLLLAVGLMVNYKYDILNQDTLREKFDSTGGEFPVDELKIEYFVRTFSQ